ncbi:MAG: phage tail sheath subtilisin-like domain-containing protein [Bradyrhizobium sp.]|nr:phage tail sheath subtilisin-like domain-containing protein [Bradyrhizobium sp.]
MPGPVDVSHPGIYVEEIASGAKSITGVATSICAFVGYAVTGPAEPLDCFSQADFVRVFGGRASGYPLGDAVEDFFRNGGSHAVIVRVPEPGTAAGRAANLLGDPLQQTGIYALDSIDLFNLLCIPRDPADACDDELQPLYQAAAAYCHKRRAMLIPDPPAVWSDHARQGRFDLIRPADLGIDVPEPAARNCIAYFPRIKKLKPASDQTGVFAACGAIAGIIARTDAARGVWKAPAGIEAGIEGITGLEFDLTDEQNGRLNPLGINCLRQFPGVGPVLWGARTLRGADVLSDAYKYVPVRRLALFIEESISRGIRFALFEPNDEILWSKLRRIVVDFMDYLLRQGASYGHHVSCDRTTMSQDDIDRGIVNIYVGFAPLKPAEFVVLRFQQQAGQARL